MKKSTVYRAFSLLLVTVVLVSSLAACSPAPHKGNISISGAFALYPLVVRWAEEYQKLYPQVRIDVTAGGAGKGMTDVLSSAVDIGMVSRDITSQEESQGAFGVGVAKDAVFLVISSQNPHLAALMKQGISKEILAKIYLTGEIKTWGQVLNDATITDEIHVYTRSDSAGAGEMWSKFLGGKVQDDLKGIGVNGDPGVTDAVSKDALGMGYNNLNYAYDPNSGKPVAGVAVVPVDINKNGQADPDETFPTRADAMKAVADGTYPSPPARILYLVTKGKPTGETKSFLDWILNDGQKYLSESGYISLPDDLLKSVKDKMR